MKNIKNYALVAAMALTFAACGNNADAPADTTEPADTSAETTEPADTAETEETEEKEETVDTAEATPSKGEGTAAGYGGDIKVEVTFGEDGKIEDIQTTHTETEDIGATAIPELEKAVIENNGTEGVDNVSGATVTSEAFKAAVDDAIANAK